MMRCWNKILAVCAASAFLLAGCNGVSEEMLKERESAIQMMENGDYESAAAVFDKLVENADSVTNFEIDILKYRAEAEYQLGDYQAAAYTYDILNQVDEERAEYYDLAALSMARAGEASAAEELLRKGEALKEQQKDETVSKAAEHARAVICNQQVLELMEQEAYEEALRTAQEGLSLADSEAAQELKFNQAVCYEYLGQWEEALALFESYAAEFGSDERTEHEITFLSGRVRLAE